MQDESDSTESISKDDAEKNLPVQEDEDAKRDIPA